MTNVPPPTMAPPLSSSSPKGNVVDIKKADGKFTPPRLLIHAVEGFGKTTMGAFAPSPLILMSGDEDGYLTLAGNGMVPDVLNGVVTNWPDLLATLTSFRDAEELPFKTLVLDAMDGFEHQCHQFVVDTQYGGDWGEHGFTGYQRGYKTAIPEWMQMLKLLESIQKKGIMIIMLDHTSVKTVKNPMGPDYDRFTTACHDKTWTATCKRMDAVLFGTFRTITDKKDGRHKGIGGTDRVIYTVQTDAYVAKNRYHMPPEIEIPNDHTKAWATVWNHIKPKKG